MITNFKKNRKKNPLGPIFFKIGGILILIIIVLLIVADIKVYRKKQQLVSQVENLKNKMQDLESKNSDLRQGILKAGDEKYIEKVAREELDLQKPGEKVISFIETKNQQPKNEIRQKSNWQIWLGWLSSSWQWIKNGF